jgi:hypothetical protein
VNPKTALTLLIIITAFWALVIVPCGGLALATVFLADGHPPANAFALIFFGSLSFPLAIVILTPLAWIAFYFKKYALALILSLMPLPTLILPMIGFSLL